jgi:arylsulfatase A-like enzyme
MNNLISMKMKNSRLFVSATLMLVVAFGMAGCRKDMQSHDKPNIIVIFTDDQGYADLGIQGMVQDIRTPNLDQLARDGIRMTHGYVTAPQCTPSRAGLMSGQYQQRLGVDHNGTYPMPLDAVLLPQRLNKAGYITGMVGKWHLDPNWTMRPWLAEEYPDILSKEDLGPSDVTFDMMLPYNPSNRGFKETFYGQMHRYWASFDLAGNDLEQQWITDNRYRLDIQSDAAVTFIERNHGRPFFLYLAYFAPHVPLEATEKYLSRFPGEMPERRRMCLAMISAIDDGVGRIQESLRKHGIKDNTLIFYISDNGAPLKLYKEDITLEFKGGAWDGSLNDPLVGEKGMLSEGGIRVPFLVSWPAALPRGVEYHEPVISLDVAATSVAVAGLSPAPALDGVNLVPYLTGQMEGSPHEVLFWRFWEQSAVRMGDWKFLKAGPREFLFDLSSKDPEKENLIDQHPDKVNELRAKLADWAGELFVPGIPEGPINRQESGWYDFYFPDTKQTN